MDPVTHGIVGLAIASFTGETVALSNPYAIGCLMGAVVPDGDIILQLKGDYSYLKNHRGMSHSIPFAFIYAIGITTILNFLYPGVSLLKLFIYALSGCISHIALDITNSYGAQILWPLNKKRVTLDLLLVYDPLLIVFSLLIVVPKLRAIIHPIFSIILFMVYLLVRKKMKDYVDTVVKSNYRIGTQDYKIKILPSMVGFLKWHFILEYKDKKIVGQLNILTKELRIISIMKNIDSSLYEAVKDSDLARFFDEFTPIYHIDCKKLENRYEFDFIDLRYYLAKDYVHHASIVLDENYNKISSLFHPYHRSRNVEI